MMSCRLAQLVARTPKSYYGVLPSQYGRAFYAAKKTDAQAKADPKSKEGAGAKPNPGSPKKSEATAQSTVGSTGPGAVGKDNRGGKEETLKGAAAKQQAPNTNYQQKRTFLTGWSVYAQDSRKPAASTSGAKKDDKEGFVSEQSKKNVDPEPSIDKGTVEMLEFYPEKPGSRLEQQLGLGQQKQNNQNPRQSGGSAQDKSGDGYDSKRHNPSRTGREQDDKYLDEALSSKSGPLVGDDKGKRRFSTSAAHSTTTPSGKGSKGSAMGAGL
ncbi:uncharacterized protein LOC129590448 isoform X2 [Paramacrobiotus metropolitanus]|uniref:uncharacterized protein LOC129590448 isoform X2 n=1 Tax=Paramacrobiotus metropolitanus TaxID=2943436 RepID=UPI002445A752|nr:uncharacterized protein LOC129590448 isoform X2 [Paramacrobiotus metropolitanus]